MFESKRISYLLVVLFLFNLIILVGYLHVINQTDGMWVYPLDDTYIHLQIAKNIAESGYFGYTNNEFCSCSSSPLYTFMLAICHKVFGGSYMTPLILNVAFANAFIIVLFCFLKKRMVAFLLMSAFLISPVLLPVQVFIGMEHTMHIFLISSAFIIFYHLKNNDYLGKGKTALVLTCSFLCLARFESMFFVVSLSFILLLCKQYRLSIGVFLAGFIPVVLFGLFSMSHGGWFFPNSLLMKGNLDFNSNIFSIVLGYMLRILSYMKSFTFSIPLLLLFLHIIYDYRKKSKNVLLFLKEYSEVIVVVMTIILHSMFAYYGPFYRYVAYLFALLYITLILSFLKLDEVLEIDSLKMILRRKIVAFVVLPLSMILCLRLAYKAYAESCIIYYASKNVYDQHIQMARFLQNYYNSAGVVANDVGAIQYFTNIRLLDLIGLTSNEVCKERRIQGNSWNLVSFIKSHPQVAIQYPIIMIYDNWYEAFGFSNMPDYKKLGWIKTAELSISNNVICGDSKVSFYTSNRDEVRQMVLSLKDFKKELPKDVILEIYE